MKHLLPESFYLRPYRARLALRSRRSAPVALLDDVPRRSEAFAEDVEHLTPVPLVAAAPQRGTPAAAGAGRPAARHWVAT